MSSSTSFGIIINRIPVRHRQTYVYVYRDALVVICEPRTALRMLNLVFVVFR